MHGPSTSACSQRRRAGPCTSSSPRRPPGRREVEAAEEREALRAWAPGVAVDVVRRDTGTADSVAAFARASAVFFTGGDQKRITTRSRPGDQDSPELAALRALLARGGVVGGGSAGCAMMGERMLLGGRNAQALGVPAAPDDDGEPVPTGPRLGVGMGFLRGVLTDSHFFERERIGRLAAALLAGPDRLGLGVGEDAALLIDVAAHTACGITSSESLLVDGTFVRRDGAVLSGMRARCIGQGDAVPLRPTRHRAAAAAARNDDPHAAGGRARSESPARVVAPVSAGGGARRRCAGAAV